MMPEYVTEKPKTVCVECEHCQIRLTSADIFTAGAEHLCKAQDFGTNWSVLTGKKETDLAVYCRDINDGNCPHFKLKTNG